MGIEIAIIGQISQASTMGDRDVNKSVVNVEKFLELIENSKGEAITTVNVLKMSKTASARQQHHQRPPHINNGVMPHVNIYICPYLGTIPI